MTLLVEERDPSFWGRPVPRGERLAAASGATLRPRPFPASNLREALEYAVVDALRRAEP